VFVSFAQLYAPSPSLVNSLLSIPVAALQAVLCWLGSEVGSAVGSGVGSAVGSATAEFGLKVGSFFIYGNTIYLLLTILAT
jgi:hypothetical protein